MKTTAPLVFGFVLLLAFLLMLVTFRSLVIAIKAVVLNLLSVAAAYGVLVLVFQEGWGKSLLGFEATGGIDPFLPILLFVILFGLSMDYHVFILSRVRESYDGGMTTDGRGRTRHQDHRGRRHQRGHRHGRGVLHLRGAPGDDLQAVRSRARGRDPDRRHHHPRRPPARVDESAGPVELVPARMAGVAPTLEHDRYPEPPAAVPAAKPVA